jgi:hypothetical protein
MYTYPNEMQTFEAASKLLTLFRGGTGARADLIHSGYVLSGFALKQIVGEPNAAQAAFFSEMTTEQALERVAAVCDPNPNVARAAALPPGFWRIVWEIAKQIIDQWLNAQAPQ